MSTIEKRVNLLAVAIPFAATLAAIVLLWNSVVSATDLAILAVMYVLTGLGVTVGFHRMLTHRSFQAPKPVEYALAILGSMAVQGPVMAWVADHRKHHAHADQEGDPHSPHVGHGDGVSGVLHGLWHAHVGWLWADDGQGQASARKYAPDVYEDRGMRLINRRFPLFVLLSLAVPALAGYALTGSLAGAATGLLWGGLVRIFMVHHVTWSVNSVCHFLGTRRFETEDQSTNVAWLSLLSFGESWHHNHHAFPPSARVRPRACC
jgi:stearoyl-CoA desaturase (Delta-9 desaturase)